MYFTACQARVIFYLFYLWLQVCRVNYKTLNMQEKKTIRGELTSRAAGTRCFVLQVIVTELPAGCSFIFRAFWSLQSYSRKTLALFWLWITLKVGKASRQNVCFVCMTLLFKKNNLKTIPEVHFTGSYNIVEIFRSYPVMTDLQIWFIPQRKIRKQQKPLKAILVLISKFPLHLNALWHVIVTQFGL